MYKKNFDIDHNKSYSKSQSYQLHPVYNNNIICTIYYNIEVANPNRTRKFPSDEYHGNGIGWVERTFRSDKTPIYSYITIYIYSVQDDPFNVRHLLYEK